MSPPNPEKGHGTHLRLPPAPALGPTSPGSRTKPSRRRGPRPREGGRPDAARTRPRNPAGEIGAAQAATPETSLEGAPVAGGKGVRARCPPAPAPLNRPSGASHSKPALAGSFPACGTRAAARAADGDEFGGADARRGAGQLHPAEVPTRGFTSVSPPPHQSFQGPVSGHLPQVAGQCGDVRLRPPG